MQKMHLIIFLKNNPKYITKQHHYYFPCTHSTCPAPLQAIKAHTNRKKKQNFNVSRKKKDEKSKKDSSISGV
jgi:hypothetical protein